MTAPPLLNPKIVDPPLLTPMGGLWSVVSQWDLRANEDKHWTASGVQLRIVNFGRTSGDWTVPWYASTDAEFEGHSKYGVEPDPVYTKKFVPQVITASQKSDHFPKSRQEAKAGTLQALKLVEQMRSESFFAQRLLADAGPAQINTTGSTIPIPQDPSNPGFYLPAVTVPASSGDSGAVVNAVSELEAKVGNIAGCVFHANLSLLAAADKVIYRSGGALKSPAGHTWCFGTGYSALGNRIICTTPVLGWKTEPWTQEAIGFQHKEYYVVTERTVMFAYEKLMGSVSIL